MIVAHDILVYGVGWCTDKREVQKAGGFSATKRNSWSGMILPYLRVAVIPTDLMAQEREQIYKLKVDTERSLSRIETRNLTVRR